MLTALSELTDEQKDLVEAVKKTSGQYSEDYWLERDRDGQFPEEFFQTMAKGGWLGIGLPEEYGGVGLGMVECLLVMMSIAETNMGGMSAASSLHMNIFGPRSIVFSGSEEQKRRWLGDLGSGRKKMCFAITEATAGLDTRNIKTKAKKEGSKYIINGSKIWTSVAQQADKIMILARTQEETKGKELSLFFTDLDRTKIQIEEISKMGRKCVDSNMIFIDNLEVQEEDRIGQEGEGLSILFKSLNSERILIGGEAIGIGRASLGRTLRYVRERRVFGREIGMNQGIQHPLSISWCELESAYLSCLRAARLYDENKHKECGIAANCAKYLAAESAFNACRVAVRSHGGMGYATEYHVERMFREVMIPYLAPVSQELALCYIAEKQLGLPKSY